MLSKVICVFCLEICMGREGRECIFENEAQRTFDIIKNTSTPVRTVVTLDVYVKL